MKKLILSLVILASSQVWAFDNDAQLIPQHEEVQLLKLLQQLEPEAVEELLSESGIQWFLENKERFEAKKLNAQSEETFTQPIELGHASMKDDKDAPKFN